jgi:3-oxoacyl-(acyl-carrier-protein) synthase
MARFSQYAVVAADEALRDAGWKPHLQNDLEQTVKILDRTRSHRAQSQLTLTEMAMRRPYV